MRVRFRRTGADLESRRRQVDVAKEMEVDRGDGNFTSRTGTPESDSGPRPDMIRVPDSPPLSAQSLSPRAPPDGNQMLESSFAKARAPYQAPRAAGAQCDELRWDSCMISVHNEVLGRWNRRLS